MPKKRTNSHKSHNNLLFIKLQSLLGLICLLIAFVILGNINFASLDIEHKTQDAKTNRIEIKESIKASDQFTRKAKPIDLPIQIVIPSAAINVNITEAQIVDGYWEVSDLSASHGVGSAYPGEKGNSVIFAHAREGLFYDLKDLVNDDVIYVLTRNRWYKYKVTEMKNVTPDQVEVVQPTEDETLTLFTCSGYQDEHRLIVIAKLLSNPS
jgi:sortase A